MIKIKVPATTANLGAGLDTLGLALSLYLTVEMSISGNGSKIEFLDGQEGLPQNPADNLIMQAAGLVFKAAGLKDCCLDLKVDNQIPVGKGLGSSASAIVAGIYGANRLLEHPFTDEQLLSWAVKLEGHADNIVPAVKGGLITVLLQADQVFYQKLSLTSGLKAVLAVPDFTLATSKSRSVLPQQINLHDAVSSLQRACFLIGSLTNGDFDRFDLAMCDPVFQAARHDFIPGYDQVINNARAAGALGVTLSGAGPSILALTLNHGKEIGAAMQKGFAAAGINSQVFVLDPSEEGMVFLE